MSVYVVYPAALKRPALDTQLRRYHRGFRRRLRSFAHSSIALGDLVYTFPALAIWIAAGQGAQTARFAALQAVADGKTLKDVAAAAGLPYWLRKLPPEAFVEKVPELPGSDSFSRRIVNTVPCDPEVTAMWLHWVVAGERLCGERFAVWIGSKQIYSSDGPGGDILWPLAGYAWFSLCGRGEARGLIRRPWQPAMSFVVAAEETRNFVLRLLLDHCRDAAGVCGRWYVEQRASGYRVVPLRKVGELEEEGSVMDNCVATYAPAVAKGECLIYSIRRGNRHVATMEVRANWARGGEPVITQLYGYGNGPADQGVVRAVTKWLGRQGRYPVSAPKSVADATVDSARWIALWAPFWEAAGQERVRRAVPVTGQISHMMASLEKLSELAKAR